MIFVYTLYTTVDSTFSRPVASLLILHSHSVLIFSHLINILFYLTLWPIIMFSLLITLYYWQHTSHTHTISTIWIYTCTYIIVFSCFYVINTIEIFTLLEKSCSLLQLISRGFCDAFSDLFILENTRCQWTKNMLNKDKQNVV